jgi:hypothetical protein
LRKENVVDDEVVSGMGAEAAGAKKQMQRQGACAFRVRQGSVAQKGIGRQDPMLLKSCFRCCPLHQPRPARENAAVEEVMFGVID